LKKGRKKGGSCKKITVYKNHFYKLFTVVKFLERLYGFENRKNRESQELFLINLPYCKKIYRTIKLLYKIFIVKKIA
jgi:hypothetical protein